jgi:cathepsin L
MKLTLSLLALVGNAAAAPKRERLVASDYSFDEYQKDFRRKYASAEETIMREKIFRETQKRVITHNARGTSWRESLNEFSDRTAEEMKQRTGIDRSMMAQQKQSQQGRKPKKVDRSSLPDSVDWRTQGVVTSIKNQGHCGSCWAFAATEALESHVAIATGALFTLSEEEFVACMPNPAECGGTGGCSGATMELAFQFAIDTGLVSEWTAPYTSYFGEDGGPSVNATMCQLTAEGYALSDNTVAGITGFHTLASNDYDELMDAVANIGPVAITVDASTWKNYYGGIYDGCNQESPELDHGVLLVGYGTDAAAGGDYWLVRNSWGPTWGEDGYIRLARTANEGERCGVDVVPLDGTGCKDGPANITVCGTCGILYDTVYPTGAFLP